MNDVVADWLSIGIEVFLCSLFIGGFLNIIAVSQEINTNVTEQQALVSEMKEYREHNQFDFKHVYAQDIIGAIYKGRGEPRVKVESSRGSYVWSVNSTPCEYTTAAISDLIDQTVVYDASIDYGLNGEVNAYVFVPHVAGCGR